MPFDGNGETNVTQQFNIDAGILELVSVMTELRHDFHRNPQTGFEETYANDRITNLLDEWGVEHKPIAETGLVATLPGRTNNSGRVIGLRADMDALNITETSGVEWASKIPGKMHACGHDGHMTMLLTALQYLKKNPDFDGTVKFLFQPAEEGLGGAKRVLKDGFLENHKMDALYAMHNWPDMPFGRAAIHTGPVMASNTNYRIILEGKSSHGALPEQGTNSVLVGAKLVLALDGLHQKFAQSHPSDKFVISTTAEKAGDFGSMSAIPDNVKKVGTIRTYNQEIKESLPDVITNVAKTVAQENGMTAKVEFPNICSPTVNNPNKAEISRMAAESVVGARHVMWDAEPAMTAEDFGEYTSRLPTSYVWFGNGTLEDPDSPHNKGLHNSGFGFNDKLIPVGAQYFVNVVKAEMPLKPQTSEPTAQP